MKTDLTQTRDRLAMNAATHAFAAVLMAAGTFLLMATLEYQLAAMLIASAATVALIIFGFGVRHGPRGEGATRRVIRSLTSRESVVPIGLVAGLMASGRVTSAMFSHVLNEMVPIVVLILTFALISAGIERSGFFRYVTAHKLAGCRGSVSRLVIYMFALPCALTYFLSNDIVILIMTPIVLEICRQPALRSTRPTLAISCFIAANTPSMGLLFGSPTNIIVGAAAGTGFFQYLALMAAPTLTAVMTSLTVTGVAAQLAARRSRGNTIDPLYNRPESSFHHSMAVWLAGFALAVAGYSVCMAADLAFHWVSIPAIALACLGLSITTGTGMNRSRPEVREIRDTVSDLPYGIIGFALSFFIVAQAIAGEIPSAQLIGWLSSIPPYLQAGSTMLLTAALVNSINDLPSAAIVSPILAQTRNGLITQSALSALNIGCYLTPIGALAGIIFFHMIREDARGNREDTPGPATLMKLGGIHFTAATLGGVVKITWSR